MNQTLEKDLLILHFELCIVCSPLCGIHKSDCYTTPASGYRVKTTGALAYVGDEGDVWSSSPTAAGSPNAAYLAFNSGSWVNTFRSNNRSYGFAVRCVQHLPGSLSRFGGVWHRHPWRPESSHLRRLGR